MMAASVDERVRVMDWRGDWCAAGGGFTLLPTTTMEGEVETACAAGCGCIGGGPEVTGVEQLSGTMEGSGMYGLRGRRPSKLF